MKTLTTQKRVKPSRPQFDIITSRQQINLFLAGQGSGKTHVGGVVSHLLVSNFPKVWGFIAANTDMQLSDSTLTRILAVWSELGLEEYDPETKEGDYVIDIKPPRVFDTSTHTFKHYRNKITFRTGCVVFIGSLENYKAHDGKEFGWAILDETKDTKEEAVKEVIVGRLRQRGLYIDDQDQLTTTDTGRPFNPLYILTSPAKVQWLNEWFGLEKHQAEIGRRIFSKTDYFRLKEGNKFVTISSSYHNAANLPGGEAWIEQHKQNIPGPLQTMLIYGNPFSQSGGEFYKCFDRERNTGATKYNKKLPLHLTFDFNTAPYMTCNVWQVVGKHAMQVDEICTESPRNSTPALCREILRIYGSHENGVYIYGDPSGRAADTRSEQGANDFKIIQNELQKLRPVSRVKSKAPPVMKRGEWINLIFEKGHEGVTVLIGSHCKNTINDYTYLKEASDGTKLKKKVKDKDKGITYEQHGHTSDANDYFLTACFSSEFNFYISGRNNTEDHTIEAREHTHDRSAY